MNHFRAKDDALPCIYVQIYVSEKGEQTMHVEHFRNYVTDQES